MQETWVRFLGQEDPLEKEMATHSSTVAWRIPWTEEPGRLQSMGLQESDMTQQRKGESYFNQEQSEAWVLQWGTAEIPWTKGKCAYFPWTGCGSRGEELVKFPYLGDYIQEDCLQLNRGADHWTLKAEESNMAIQGSLASIQKTSLKTSGEAQRSQQKPQEGESIRYYTYAILRVLKSHCNKHTP